MSSALILAKQKDGIISRDTLCCLEVIKEVDDISVYLYGSSSELANMQGQLSKIDKIKMVYQSECPDPKLITNESIVSILFALCKEKKFEYICGPTTLVTKSVFPKLSSLFDTNMISNVIRVNLAENLFTQSIYANSINRILKNSSPTKIFTLRCSSLVPYEASNQQNSNNQTIVQLDPLTPLESIQCTGIHNTQSQRPDYSVSPVIVVGGRGVGSKKGFEEIYQLADHLHGNVGGTRGAVDNQYIENTYQIGQTGKYISPPVYLGLGVSGAAQHLAGIKESKVIMAINKDSQANIFKVCDYGFVGDIKACVPEMNKLLK